MPFGSKYNTVFYFGHLTMEPSPCCLDWKVGRFILLTKKGYACGITRTQQDRGLGKKKTPRHPEMTGPKGCAAVRFTEING